MKKRFKARESIWTKEEKIKLKTYSAIRLSLSDEFEILEDYLAISRKRRNNSLAILKLQENILRDVLSHQKTKDQYRIRLEKIKKELRNVNDDEIKKNLQSSINKIKNEIYYHKTIIKALKTIVDGIAWRMFNYDRAILYTLAEHPSGGDINELGLRAEIGELYKIYESGTGIAILNDLTNFLKIGDITVAKKDGTYEIIEVKSSRRRGRRIRKQEETLKSTVEFFNFREKKIGESKLIIDTYDILPENYLKNVLNIILKAKKNGAYSELISRHLFVECVDFNQGREFGELKKILKERSDRVFRDWENDIVASYFHFESFDYPKNFVPYSIFPYPENICIDLMCMAIWLRIYINISEVFRYFENCGWKVIKDIDNHFKEFEQRKITNLKEVMFGTVQKGPLKIEIPPALIGRLIFEFLKPKILVKHFEESLRRGSIKSGNIFLINYSKEPTIWN
ncbi:MAG: hypothetical protein ACTSVV_10775 [Promethearchaeota archaeon]